MAGLFVFIFVLTVFLCVSTYVFYPLIVWLIGLLRPFRPRRTSELPSVSIIIPAYNEGKDIARKLENTLALDYPEEKIEVLVGSDGSTDQTDEFVRHFENRGVRLFSFEKNRGKTAVQNDLAAHSTGEILVFTDAASFLNRDALVELVCRFADDRIGCVAGKMRFVATEKNLTTRSQGLYWKYEVWIRELESRLGTLIGVDGPLYAVRRGCYVPLQANMISDLVTPLLVREMGKMVILEPGAVVDEEPTSKSGQEFTTRRRITLRGLVGLSGHRSLLNPLRHPWLTFQIVFHKVIRWFVGLLLALNLLACFALYSHWFFQAVLVCYFLFFLMGILGWTTEKIGIRIKMFSVPYYFCLVNMAATMGILDFIRKKEIISWTPVR